MQAQQVMTEYPATIHRNETVSAAIQRLAALDVRHLPVVDDSDHLIGMVSERDVLGALGPEGTPDEVIDRAFQQSVDSVMTTDVIAAEPETNVQDLIEVMIERKVGAVPVIDPTRVVVGIVSYIDVLRAVGRGDVRQ